MFFISRIVDKIITRRAEAATGISYNELITSDLLIDLDAIDKEIAARYGRGSILLQEGQIECKHEIQKELV